MPSKSGGARQAVDVAMVGLLSELAEYLVAAGVSFPRLTGLMRLAYFRAASNHARFGNDRVNQSAVAAMTGLTRVEVRQFAKQLSPAAPRTRDRFDALIEGWLTDPTFLTTSYSPRPLSIKRGARSFGELVARYGGDIPARSMLRELKRHQYVSIRQGYVSIKRTIRQTREEARLQKAASGVAALLRSAPHETPRTPLRTIALEVAYPSTSDKGRVSLQKRIARGLETFLAGVEAAGIAASKDSPPPKVQKNRVTRTKILLMTEDVSR